MAKGLEKGREFFIWMSVARVLLEVGSPEQNWEHCYCDLGRVDTLALKTYRDKVSTMKITKNLISVNMC